MEGFSLPGKRSDRVVLEANMDYWDKTRFPQVKRIIFDNTSSQEEALEFLKREEGHVDLVTGLRPVDTLRVAQSSFAKVVKNRGIAETVYGHFNMLKVGSPWKDLRLRQAVNYAINREDLIRFAAKGNGTIIPALVPKGSFGFDPDLTPYSYDSDKARQLLREAGYPGGLAITLIAPENLEVQATVVSEMLEGVGFLVERQILDGVAYNGRTQLSHLDGPAEHQKWDIALSVAVDWAIFPAISIFHQLALDGPYDWIIESPELRRLFEGVLGTVDREEQHTLTGLIDRHTFEQAYFLFLYNPIQLNAVNKAVEYVPHVVPSIVLGEISVTDGHWSVRK